MRRPSAPLLPLYAAAAAAATTPAPASGGSCPGARQADTQLPCGNLIKHPNKKASSPDECCAICATFPACTHWAYVPVKKKMECHVKSGKSDCAGKLAGATAGLAAVTPPSPAPPAPAPPAPVPGQCPGTRLPQTQLQYGDVLVSLPAATPDECCAECAEQGECSHWVFNPNDAKACNLKKGYCHQAQGCPGQHAPDMTSGAAPPPPPFTGQYVWAVPCNPDDPSQLEFSYETRDWSTGQGRLRFAGKCVEWLEPDYPGYPSGLLLDDKCDESMTQSEWIWMGSPAAPIQTGDDPAVYPYLFKTGLNMCVTASENKKGAASVVMMQCLQHNAEKQRMIFRGDGTVSNSNGLCLSVRDAPPPTAAFAALAAPLTDDVSLGGGKNKSHPGWTMPGNVKSCTPDFKNGSHGVDVCRTVVHGNTHDAARYCTAEFPPPHADVCGVQAFWSRAEDSEHGGGGLTIRLKYCSVPLPTSLLASRLPDGGYLTPWFGDNVWKGKPGSKKHAGWFNTTKDDPFTRVYGRSAAWPTMLQLVTKSGRSYLWGNYSSQKTGLPMGHQLPYNHSLGRGLLGISGFAKNTVQNFFFKYMCDHTPVPPAPKPSFPPKEIVYAAEVMDCGELQAFQSWSLSGSGQIQLKEMLHPVTQGQLCLADVRNYSAPQGLPLQACPGKHLNDTLLPCGNTIKKQAAVSPDECCGMCSALPHCSHWAYDPVDPKRQGAECALMNGEAKCATKKIGAAAGRMADPIGEQLQVAVAACDGSDMQRWVSSAQPSGGLQLRNAGSGQCLRNAGHKKKIYNAVPSDTARLELGACDDTPEASWFKDTYAYPVDLLRSMLIDKKSDAAAPVGSGVRSCVGAHPRINLKLRTGNVWLGVLLPGPPPVPAPERDFVCDPVPKFLPFVPVPKIHIGGLPLGGKVDMTGLVVELPFIRNFTRCALYNPLGPVNLSQGTVSLTFQTARVPWELQHANAYGFPFGVHGSFQGQGRVYSAISLSIEYSLVKPRSIKCGGFAMSLNHQSIWLYGGASLNVIGRGQVDKIKETVGKVVPQGAKKIIKKYCPVAAKAAADGCADRAGDGGLAAVVRCALQNVVDAATNATAASTDPPPDIYVNVTDDGNVTDPFPDD